MSLPKTLVSPQQSVAELSCGNRREHVSTQYRDFSKVARCAERMLQEQDWIWAIWLFGSRARCDARVDSDWDLALITASYKNGKALDYDLLAPPPHTRVSGPIQCHQIPIHLFMEKRLSHGHVAFAVAGEGVPLAQRNWLLPTHLPFEEFHMDHRTYQRYLEQFEKGLSNTRYVFERLADPSLHDEWHLAYDDLLTASVDLAEGLIKAGCLARDLKQDIHTHDMAFLATELRRSETDANFLSLIKSLNGTSERHNQARYLTAPSLRDAELAFNRTYRAFAAAANELRAHRDTFQENGDHEALMIHETKTHRITSSLSRLDRMLKESEPPQVAHDVIQEELRPIIPHIWSRKPELIEVTRVLQRGIDEIDRGIDNDRER